RPVDWAHDTNCCMTGPAGSPETSPPRMRVPRPGAASRPGAHGPGDLKRTACPAAYPVLVVTAQEESPEGISPVTMVRADSVAADPSQLCAACAVAKSMIAADEAPNPPERLASLVSSAPVA